MSDIYSKIFNLYDTCGFKIKLYVMLRWLVTPFNLVEGFVPKEGTILDLGCGYGILSNLLALKCPKRKVLGVDFDKKRISIVSKSPNKLDNVDFLCGDLKEWQPIECDSIVLYDVLHHMNYDKQEQLLKLCYKKLNPNGTIVIKENGNYPYWKYLFNCLHEKVTRIVGLTKGDELCFRKPEEFIKLLSDIGFQVKAEYLKSYLPYSLVLFIAKK